jgi:hypothetical protein
MKKTILIALTMLCATFAAKILAAEPVYLPTTIYRSYAGYNYEKIELAYDEFGHITSIEVYKWENGVYENTPSEEYFYEYQLLPNGDFVKSTIIEMGTWWKEKVFYTYDDKGMELKWEYYYYDDNTDDWVLESGREAVLDGAGIRTGIKVYDRRTQTWALHPGYKFDAKGRTIEYVEEYDDDDDYISPNSKREGEKRLKTKTYKMLPKAMQPQSKDIKKHTCTWTWDDNDNLTAMSMISDFLRLDMTYQNVVTVRNGEYINVYDLIPYNFEVGEIMSEHGANIPIYAWEDYAMHKWFFNATFRYVFYGMVQTGEITTTYNDVTKETTVTTAYNGSAMATTTVYKEKANKSWSIVTTNPYSKEEEGIDYNSRGFMTLEYHKEVDYDEDHYVNTNIYAREYDVDGRPIKTTCFARNYDGSQDIEMFIETYDAWTSWTGWTDITTTAIPRLDVYPTVTSGLIYIDNPANETLRLYNASGMQVFETMANIIDMSKYPKGLYILVTGNRTAKIIKK